jgi:Putative zinc-finger
MNCTRIAKLIPLYTGGDLPPLQAEIVREHLRNCAQCNQIAAEYEESRDWLRALEAPQLDDAVFNDLRDGVHSEIRRTRSRPSLFELLAPVWEMRFAPAAAAVLLLLISGLIVYFNRHQSMDIPLTAIKKHPDSHRIPASQRENKVANNDLNQQIVRRRSRRGAPAKQKLPYFSFPALETMALFNEPTTPRIDLGELESIPAVDIEEELGAKDDIEMLRIEIQTADPNIRIIWLGPKDKPNSSTQ